MPRNSRVTNPRPKPARRPRRRASPTVRRAALWGAPLALAAGLGIGAVMSGSIQAPHSARDIVTDALDLTGKLGLVVTDIQVEGRQTTDAATILAALDARYGTPILGVSPARAKQQLEALPWVRSAAIERRLPGTIAVYLVERHPLAVWQHDGRQELIDQDGTVIPVTDLSRFAKLPTIVGDDRARLDAAQLLGLLASEPSIYSHVTAAVRIGDRRWNVQIDNSIEVMLPEDDKARAWSKLAELQRSSQILQRNVETIDMRLPDRLVMRVTDTTPKDAPGPKKIHAPGKST